MTNIDALLDMAALVDDLDRALATVFDVVDPANERDLGGQAAVWFSAPITLDSGETADARTAWPTLDLFQRRAQLAAFQGFADYLMR